MQTTKLAHHFTHDGHAYKIFRRPHLPTGIWYLHFQKNGRRFNRSLDTTTQKSAETNARRLISAVKEKRWADLAQAAAKRAYADLESIIATYEQNPTGPSPATVRNNISSFRLILKRAQRLENLAGVSAALLTPALVRAYKNAILADLPARATDADRARAKRSANSTLRQARSLFAQTILPIYEDAQLTLPDLKPFLKESGFLKVPAPDYQLPTDALIATTFRALHKLRTSGHPEKLNRFKAVCLAAGGGLRKGEMAVITWGSFTQRGERVYIHSDKIAKGGRPIDLPFQTEIWEWLLSIKPAAAQPADPILTVRFHTDIENIFRKVSRWMTKLGWRTQKKIHEFRAYIGSKVAERYGILAARDFLRHATSDITERHYGRYISTKNVDVQLSTAQNL